MKKRGFLTIIIVFVALCLIPLALYPVKGKEAAESGEIATVLPSIRNEDGSGINRAFFAEAGDFFTGNFAFRNELVSADSALRKGIFHTSTQDNVVVGKDGFLFYGSTVNDFFGKKTLSDEQLSAIAYNMALMQETLSEDGITYVFTVAPNKNSLYSQYMPVGYRTNRKTKNITRLIPYLEEAGVNYVNLHAHFSSQEEILYHKTDSHWNNKGAAQVNALLLDAAGKESTDYGAISYEERNDFTGDLFRMLYPAVKGTEKEVYYEKERDYTYDWEIDSTHDAEIATTNEKKGGSLVMFRDSFGDSLLPFTADEYGSGYFSRALPYPAYVAYERGADTVITEIVERNLYYLQRLAPVLAAHDQQEFALPEETDSSYQADAVIEEADAGESTYVKISGHMDSTRTKVTDRTYVSLYDEEQGFGYIFPTYHTSEQRVASEEAAESEKRADDGIDGYAVYIDPDTMANGEYQITFLAESAGSLVRSDVLSSYVIED